MKMMVVATGTVHSFALWWLRPIEMMIAIIAVEMMLMIGWKKAFKRPAFQRL